MSATLPFGTIPYGPSVSPLASGRERNLLDFLTALAAGHDSAATGVLTDRLGQQSGDPSGGFTGTGLRGDIADVTRGDMNLGPQAGLMKNANDVARTAQTLAAVAANPTPMGIALGIARSPAAQGLMSNVANYGDIAAKTAATEARGGPAMGGVKGSADRPSALSPEEAQAQMAAAVAADMGGVKGGAKGDMGGDVAGTSNENSSPGGADKGDTSSDFAQGGLIQLVGGGKVARGPGGGMDDLIPTTIEGQRAAALSDGEFVMPADVVAMMGDGSSNAGSQRLYDLVRQIREAKTGTGKQAEPLQFTDILRRTLS
jgi:hypothetical protein